MVVIMKKGSEDLKASASQNDNDSPVSFEQSLESLEGIVRELERGQLSLEDSLKQFSQATNHLRFCYSALENAQRRVALLKDVKSDGEPVLQDVEDLRFVKTYPNGTS
jgi:exodeoxyribonuclease VII small subunit